MAEGEFQAHSEVVVQLGEARLVALMRVGVSSRTATMKHFPIHSASVTPTLSLQCQNMFYPASASIKRLPEEEEEEACEIEEEEEEEEVVVDEVTMVVVEEEEELEELEELVWEEEEAEEEEVVVWLLEDSSDLVSLIARNSASVLANSESALQVSCFEAHSIFLLYMAS